MKRRYGRLVCFAVLAACLIAATANAQTVDQAELAGLAELFARDASAGYETALDLFIEAKERGDVQSMMDVLRVPMRPISRFGPEIGITIALRTYGRPIDDMAVDVAAAAKQAGRWDLLSEALAMQGIVAAWFGEGGCPGSMLRALNLMRVAQAASEKAGGSNLYLDALHTWLEIWGATEEALRKDLDAVAGRAGTELKPLVAAMLDAASEGRDAEAIALHSKLVDHLFTEADPTAYRWAGWLAAGMLWMRGTEPMIPRLRQLVDERGDVPPETAGFGQPIISNYTGAMCWHLWFGRNDLYRETGYWARTHYVPGKYQPGWVLGLNAGKLARFGREAEAMDMLVYRLGIIMDAPPEARVHACGAILSLWPGVPAGLRRDAVRVACEEFERGQSLRYLGKVCSPFLGDRSELGDRNGL